MIYKTSALILSICLLLNWQGKGQSMINWEWQNNANISFQDIVYKNNSIYAVGNFNASSVTLGTNTYYNAGGSDIIICKLDTLGNVIWSQHFGSSNNESLINLCVDNNEDVCVIGTMEGVLNLGTNTLSSNGGTDILMIKCSSAGSILLAKNIGTTGMDYGNDIATDYNNDIYIVANKSTNNLTFAGNTNGYSNAILKLSSIGIELFMTYMRGGLTGLPASAGASIIKYSEYDSTIIIGGKLYGGTNLVSNYTICNSSNLNLSTWVTASSSWGAYNGSYLCRTNLNGVSQNLAAIGGGSSSSIYDIATNPLNGDYYFTQRVHYPSSQNDYNYWKKCNITTGFSNLPINLSSNVMMSSSYPGAPLKINYDNNSLYGLLYQQHLFQNVYCTDYYAAKLDLNTNVSQLHNLDYAQNYSGCFGFNNKFCLGSQNKIGLSCPSNCVIPSYSLNPAPDTPLCTGSITIGYPDCYYVKGGIPPYTYSWSPSIGLSATNIPQPIVSGISNSMTYTLTVTDATNNILYDTIHVIHNYSIPVITYSYAPTPFCAGDTVIVNLSGANYYYPYSNTPGNYLSNPLILAPTKDTSIVVMGYDSSGCVGYNLIVLEAFKIEAHALSPIVCKYSNSTLVATSGNAYTWQPGNLIGDTITVPISASTIFTVTGVDAFGCTATATSSVLPSSTLSSTSSNATICAYDSIQLTAISDGYHIGPQILPIGYCLPPTTNTGGWKASINNFKFNDLINNNNGIQTNGFGDFTSLPFTTVKRGSLYSFKIERLVNYGVEYAIWIDYNRNGSFIDSGELVYSSYIPYYTNLETTNSITIPITAGLGLTRIRVLCINPGASNNYLPCMALSGPGEYEDYTINIISEVLLNNISWNPTTIPSIGSVVTAYPSASTVYTVTSIDFQNCTLVDSVSINVLNTSSSLSNLSVCSNQTPYNWNGQTLMLSGIYTFTTANSIGCDSVASLNLTVESTTSSYTSLSICPNQIPYLWNGQTLMLSGIYTFTTTNSIGCDSVASLNLTVLPATSSNISLSICPNQIPYSWNGQSLISSGIYYDTLANAVGCDSIATLNFTVHPIPQPILTQNNFQLICSNVNALTYQWYLNGNLMPGNTDTLIINQNGIYVVAITDTAGCIGFDTLQVSALEINNFVTNVGTISLYPNPTTASLILNYSLLYEANISIKLFDITGKLISDITKNETQSKGNYQKEIDLRKYNCSQGVYILQLNDGVQNWNQRVILQ